MKNLPIRPFLLMIMIEWESIFFFIFCRPLGKLHVVSEFSTNHFPPSQFSVFIQFKVRIGFVLIVANVLMHLQNIRSGNKIRRHQS